METEFCKFLGEMEKDTGTVSMKPIGFAKNSINQPTLNGWKDKVTEIILKEEYSRGLDGIEDYSHVIVVYFLDKEKECHLKHHPQNREDVPFIGIFACRCPQRPNRIAMSTVKLLDRKNNIIKVKDLDILNGTPVFDIKPYTPQYDNVINEKVPKWVNNLVFD